MGVHSTVYRSCVIMLTTMQGEQEGWQFRMQLRPSDRPSHCRTRVTSPPRHGRPKKTRCTPGSIEPVR
jgi:hypothetical protein